jgi:NADPH-dependent curcumin reductase CurA
MASRFYAGMIEVRGRRGRHGLVTAAAGRSARRLARCNDTAAARVVGIAGGPDKAEEVVDDYGFDAGVFSYYRAPDFLRAAQAQRPTAFDVLFENVGGEVMEAAIARMNPRGRIAPLRHDLDLQRPGRHALRLAPIMAKRLKVQGFNLDRLRRLVASTRRASWPLGQARPDQGRGDDRRRADPRAGSAQHAVRRLNVGKLLVRLP